MKGKIFLLSAFTLFIALYLAFLFILPRTFDLNKYEPQITKLIQENTGYKVEFKNIKIKPAKDLSAEILADRADLKYSNGEKFAQINNLGINISLFHLFLKEIKINKISVDKLMANLDKGRIVNDNHKDNLSTLKPFNLSTMYIKRYRISLIDEQNNYAFKGSDLKISDFVPNKKIKIKTNGDLILNGRKQINYNFAINSKFSPENKSNNRELTKIFEDLYKYNVNAVINTDLNIKENNIDGKIDIDKLSFVFGNHIYPQSNLKLAFKGNKAIINSSLHISKDSKALITGLLKTGKNKAVDLHVTSDLLNIKDVLLIVRTASVPFGQKNLQNIDANGFIKADFNIKSNFKKVQSDGYLKVKDASIKGKSFLVESINTDIDFSNDTIKIPQANAKFNKQPIIIKGIIDKNANADITVLANNLKLKDILISSGNQKVLKDNDINGLLNAKVFLKGRLNKASPRLNVVLSNINVKNKPTQILIRLDKIAFNTNLNEKDLIINPTPLYVNNIKTTLEGKISGINSNPSLNPLTVNIPNQISIPAKGYGGTNILLKGNLVLKGDIHNPQIKGKFDIPLINIPSSSIVIQSTILNISNNNSNVVCSLARIGNLLINNIISNIAFKNNSLYLDNLRGDAYLGKIGGNINYNFTNKKTTLNIQGRGLSANPALRGLTGKDDDIYGQLDFDSNISMYGNSKNERLRNLKGYTNFIISNGKMGVLGKFEHLLYAQNIIANSVFKSTLNLVAKALTVKNTGVYKYMKGRVAFSNGWSNIIWLKTSGPSMSLYVTGRCYMPDNTGNLIILGRISDDVVRILGPIGEFSMDKAISYIPRIGEITEIFANQFTTDPYYENISQIPYLTPKTEFPTKEFKVVIDGDIRKQSSVKSFKWLSRPKIIQKESLQPEKPSAEVPDFVKNLPDLKH